MVVIFSQRGIFDPSGCKVYIEEDEFYCLMIRSLSSGYSKIVAEFQNLDLAQGAHDSIKSTIRHGNKTYADIQEYETMDGQRGRINEVLDEVGNQ